jgi:HrpA-like RNA helicase
MDCLAMATISQASAKHRSGCAGCTGPGKSYRLYMQAAFVTRCCRLMCQNYSTNCGLQVSFCNPKTGMDSLVVAPISRASAKQRAGRTALGKCCRLYAQTLQQ